MATKNPRDLLQTFPNPKPERDYVIHHVAPEFTAHQSRLTWSVRKIAGARDGVMLRRAAICSVLSMTPWS